MSNESISPIHTVGPLSGGLGGIQTPWSMLYKTMYKSPPCNRTCLRFWCNKYTENKNVSLLHDLLRNDYVHICLFSIRKIQLGYFMPLDVCKLVACCCCFPLFHCVSKTYTVIYVKNGKILFCNIFIKHESSFK